MRAFFLSAMLLGASIASASAAELTLIAPGFAANAGIRDLADAYSKKTGIKVTIKTSGMGKILSDTETATPAADLVIVPMDLMGTLALNKGIVAGTFTPLGRVEIGLAVKAGAPHPDISTVEKFVAVLKGAQNVERSNPAGGGSMEAGMIDELLKRPEFAGVHSTPSTNGEGGQALARGEGDMALQLICEIYPHPEISLVAPLPPELGMHIDGAVAVSSRSADPKDAAAFIAYITAPEAAAVWKAKGLNRY